MAATPSPFAVLVSAFQAMRHPQHGTALAGDLGGSRPEAELG